MVQISVAHKNPSTQLVLGGSGDLVSKAIRALIGMISSFMHDIDNYHDPLSTVP